MAHVEKATPVSATATTAHTVTTANNGATTWVPSQPLNNAHQNAVDPNLRSDGAPVTNEARKAALVAAGKQAGSVDGVTT